MCVRSGGAERRIRRSKSRSRTREILAHNIQMKRSFSLKELQSAIDERESSASRQSIGFLYDMVSTSGDHGPPNGPTRAGRSSAAQTLMRKSKSMTSFSDATSEQMARDGVTPADIKLPNLLAMVSPPSRGHLLHCMWQLAKAHKRQVFRPLVPKQYIGSLAHLHGRRAAPSAP